MDSIKCEKCDREFEEHERRKAYIWEGKTMCDECLFTMGVDANQAMSWITFVESQNKDKPHTY